MARDVDEVIRGADRWSAEMTALRPVLVDAGLTEAVKWGKPCYSHDGANVAIMQPMSQFLALMFFKGMLLADPEQLLESQGPNSRSARRMRFTSVDEITDRAAVIGSYVTAALALEAAGVEVGPAPELELVPELAERLAADATLAAGFDSLTPGRQREYNLHVGGAKQSSTRHTRIDRLADRIRSGKGMRDR